jgi:hypothetical protein
VLALLSRSEKNLRIVQYRDGPERREHGWTPNFHPVDNLQQVRD